MNKVHSNAWYKRLLGWLVLFAIVFIVIVAFAKSVGVDAHITANLGPASIDIQPTTKEKIEKSAIEPDPGSIPQSSNPNNRCPYDARGFAMYYNYNYGPLNNFWIMATTAGFVVTDPNFYQSSYLPSTQNTWISLNGSPFDVCLDSYGTYSRPHS